MCAKTVFGDKIQYETLQANPASEFSNRIERVNPARELSKRIS